MLRTLAEKVDPKHAALLVIDIQNDFCHPEGFSARVGRDISIKQQMMPRLLRLLAEARQARVNIIFTQQINSPWTMSQVFREHKLRRLPQVSQLGCEEGSWGAQFYQVVPQPNECVIIKHRYSAFVDTNLDLILRSMGIKTLIMTGVATNICVESTARDGFMKDYYIVFVGDCTATSHIEDHEATLRNVQNVFGIVATSDELIAAWQRLA